MKHDLKVTLFLMILFLASQVVGLFLLNMSIEALEYDELGNIEVIYTEPLTGRPQIEEKESFAFTIVMILAGTAILLLLIRMRLFKVWKAWFFLAIFGALSISFSVIIPVLPSLALALLLTFLKLYRPNVFVHNATEVFIYAGITILLSPLFNVFWGVILLVAISIYDALAVWKLKHMITLATAQAEEKMFAGLMIPYGLPKGKESKIRIKAKIPRGIVEKDVKSAILGGGDIAFPMIFAGSVMTSLIEAGITLQKAYFLSLLIPAFAGTSLFLLFIKSKKDRFYPAMPFISAGCFAGLGMIFLINRFIL